MIQLMGIFYSEELQNVDFGLMQQKLLPFVNSLYFSLTHFMETYLPSKLAIYCHPLTFAA